jgi:hypothetical protein
MRKEDIAPWDRTTKIISALTVLILLAASVAVHNLFAAGLAVLILVLAWVYTPREYRLDDRFLTIGRPAGDVQIKREDIREVHVATSGDLSGSIRLWGSGGLFGYYGLFRTARLGNCRWYVTDRRKCVVLITPAKTLVLSPVDPAGFVAELQPAGSPPPIPGYAPGRDSRLGVLIGGSITIAGIALAVAAMLYSPGAPGYTLTPDSLSIHDRFYPVTLRAADVDLSEMRIVNIATDKDWRPVLRTGGFANFHYHAGHFRVASGRSVRMYRADGKSLVLLPAKQGRTPVLYQVSQPEQFMSEVRREWTYPPAR